MADLIHASWSRLDVCQAFELIWHSNLFRIRRRNSKPRSSMIEMRTTCQCHRVRFAASPCASEVTQQIAEAKDFSRFRLLSKKYTRVMNGRSRMQAIDPIDQSRLHCADCHFADCADCTNCTVPHLLRFQDYQQYNRKNSNGVFYILNLMHQIAWKVPGCTWQHFEPRASNLKILYLPWADAPGID